MSMLGPDIQDDEETERAIFTLTGTGPEEWHRKLKEAQARGETPGTLELPLDLSFRGLRVTLTPAVDAPLVF